MTRPVTSSKIKPAPVAAPKAVKALVEKASLKLDKAKAKGTPKAPEKRAPGRPRKVSA